MVERNEKFEGLSNKSESLSKEAAIYIYNQKELEELKNITTNKKLKG